MPSDEQLVLFLTSLVCSGPGLNPWPHVPRSGHSASWATGASKKNCKLMVLVHVCFIYITAIFFTLTKSAKTHGQKLEHWQNYNNSNGKLALKHTDPFPTEYDDCRIPSPCSRTWLWFSTCFPLVDFPTGKYRKHYYIVTFHLSSCVVYAENFQNIFSIHKKHISFHRAISFGKWNVNSGMEKQDKCFYIHLFRGGGEGNPIVWQHDTRVKNGTIS